MYFIINLLIHICGLNPQFVIDCWKVLNLNDQAKICVNLMLNFFNFVNPCLCFIQFYTILFPFMTSFGTCIVPYNMKNTVFQWLSKNFGHFLYWIFTPFRMIFFLFVLGDHLIKANTRVITLLRSFQTIFTVYFGDWLYKLDNLSNRSNSQTFWKELFVVFCHL
jgi:hypothetical protein